MYQPFAICGFNCLASFTPKKEYVDIDLLILDKQDIVHEINCLIPHGIDDLELASFTYEGDLFLENKTHVQSAISALENIILSGVMKESDRNNKILSMNYGVRTSAEFLKLANIKDISGVDLYELYVKNCEFSYLLRGWPYFRKNYLSDKEIENFKARSVKYRESNEEYFKKKSIELANFWVSCIGQLGSSGHYISDTLHNMMERPSLEQSEVDLFRASIIELSLKIFKDGSVPNMFTDYSPQYDLAKIFKENQLSKIAVTLPWKTRMAWDFTDRPTNF